MWPLTVLSLSLIFLSSSAMQCHLYLLFFQQFYCCCFHDPCFIIQAFLSPSLPSTSSSTHVILPLPNTFFVYFTSHSNAFLICLTLLTVWQCPDPQVYLCPCVFLLLFFLSWCWFKISCHLPQRLEPLFNEKMLDSFSFQYCYCIWEDKMVRELNQKCRICRVHQQDAGLTPHLSLCENI